jgi:hypothetical protein
MQRVGDLEALLHGAGVDGIDVIDHHRDARACWANTSARPGCVKIERTKVATIG